MPVIIEATNSSFFQFYTPPSYQTELQNVPQKELIDGFVTLEYQTRLKELYTWRELYLKEFASENGLVEKILDYQEEIFSRLLAGIETKRDRFDFDELSLVNMCNDSLNTPISQEVDVRWYREKRERMEQLSQQDTEYATAQEITLYEEIVLGRKISEKSGIFLLNGNGKLVANTQRDETLSFPEYQAQKLLQKSKHYLKLKFGENFSAREIEWIASAMTSSVSAYDFWSNLLFGRVNQEFTVETQAGLEKEEVRVLVEIQEFMQKGRDGSSFVVPSAYSDKRDFGGVGTNPLSVVVVYPLKTVNGVKQVDLINGFMDHTYAVDLAKSLKNVIDVPDLSEDIHPHILLRNGFVSNSPASEILEQFGIEENKWTEEANVRTLKFFEKDIHKIIEAVLDGRTDDVIQMRSVLSPKLLAYRKQIHKQIESENRDLFTAADYQAKREADQYSGDRSGCSSTSLLSGNEVMLPPGVKIYGDQTLPDRWFCEECRQALHCIDEDDPTTFYANCEGCGASGNC